MLRARRVRVRDAYDPQFLRISSGMSDTRYVPLCRLRSVVKSCDVKNHERASAMKIRARNTRAWNGSKSNGQKVRIASRMRSNLGDSAKATMLFYSSIAGPWPFAEGVLAWRDT